MARPRPVLREHRQVCDCHTRMRWVVYDQKAMQVIGHFRTEKRAKAILDLAKLAARHGYSIQRRVFP